MNNTDRAHKALNAIYAYKTGWGVHVERGDDEIQEAIGDLLCDLRHLVDTLDLSDLTDSPVYEDSAQDFWELLLNRGEYHYFAEVNGDE